MTTIVLSAHLDDGVLSASHVLARPGSTLVTVFSGLPPAELGVTPWDRFTGASSSLRRQAERLAEDDEAAGILGCAVHRLGELERYYRSGDIDRDAVVDRLRALTAGVTEVWVPVGIGGHPDHLLTREVGMAACDARQLRLYADLPYTLDYGWPTWVTGAPQQEFYDLDYWIAAELAKRGLDPAGLTGHSHRLGPDSRALKRRAVSAYRTQVPGLRLGHRWDALLGHETWWRPRA